jgi:hypothetical protein
MSFKKYTVGMLALMLVLGMGFAHGVRADNENGNGHNEQNQEARNAGTTLEIHVTDNGKVLVRGAKVTGVSGSVVTATTAWGTAIASWTINTSSTTQLVRRYGGNMSSLSEITVGDFVSFSGTIASGATSPFVVDAKVLKDWSIQKKNATFEGTVGTVNSAGNSFVLVSNNRGNITINVATGTTIKKDNTTGVFADIVTGLKVTATGLYNNLTSVLDASTVKVRTNTPTPESRTTVEGSLSSIAGTTAPTTFVVNSHGVDYTVSVATTTSVLNKNWLTATLSQFVVGNTVRVYGVVHADHTIDATVIRNTSLN